MDKKELINLEVQKTLSLLDHAERLSQDPYFYTRLKPHLSRKNQRFHRISHLFLKPAMLSLLTAFNLGVAFWYYNQKAPKQKSSREQLIEILSSNLQLNTSQNFFDTFK